LDGFFKMVDREPNFALRVEHAAEIRPGDRELRLRFNRF
jgi:hypothetical protein